MSDVRFPNGRHKIPEGAMGVYTIVFLHIDPFVDSRLAMGAIVTLPTQLAFVRSERALCDDCVRRMMGGEPGVAFVRMCIADIERDVDSGLMPRVRSLGQSWSFGEPRRIPFEAEDPIEWVRSLFRAER